MAWWKWAIGVAGFGILVMKYRIGGRRFRDKVDMSGKTVIITGANTGIGKATATELAKRDARIILAVRDVVKGNQALSDIRHATKGKTGDLVVKQLDLASFASIRKFVEEVLAEESKIDVLINNAAVYQCEYAKTEDGFEMQMGVNHLGHFLLTNLLKEKLIHSTPSRVVIVSSGLAALGMIDFENLNSQRQYNKKAAYHNSKLANNLFARELSKRLDGTQVGVYCMSPGMCRTELGRHVPIPKLMMVVLYPLYWLLTRTAWEGCQTVLHCGMAPSLASQSGKFYKNCAEVPWTEKSLDDGVAKKLWEVSEKFTQI